jgi:hypothetical protein
MTPLTLVIYALWVFPIIVQGAIVFGMVRRKLVKSFPIFFTYTLWVLFSEAGLLFVNPAGNVYANLYWCKDALAVVLGLAVIVEVLRYILPPYSSPKFLRSLVSVLTALFAVTTLLMLIFAKPVVGNCGLCQIAMLAERCVRFVQASSLIVVIGLMSALGLTWHHEALGILAGFGVYSTGALVALECSALHWMNFTAFSMLNSAAYNVAALIWAFYILRPRRRTPLDRLPNADLTEWNNALNNYVCQRPRRQ